MERKVVAITGGAQGQGRLHAVKFAQNGYDVALGDMQDPASPSLPGPLRNLRAWGQRFTPRAAT